MDGFRKGNHEEILSCLAEDVIWDMPGIFHWYGKVAFEKEVKNEDFLGTPAITIMRMIEEDNIVVVEGAVQSKRKDGGDLSAVFCDVFHFENGKIKCLTSYMMDNSVD